MQDTHTQHMGGTLHWEETSLFRDEAFLGKIPFVLQQKNINSLPISCRCLPLFIYLFFARPDIVSFTDDR